jgi:hypothetical protein
MRADWPRIPLPVTFKALETSAKLGADVGQLLDIEKPALGVILCEASWHGMLHLPIYSASVIFSDRFRPNRAANSGWRFLWWARLDQRIV